MLLSRTSMPCHSRSSTSVPATKSQSCLASKCCIHPGFVFPYLTSSVAVFFLLLFYANAGMIQWHAGSLLPDNTWPLKFAGLVSSFLYRRAVWPVEQYIVLRMQQTCSFLETFAARNNLCLAFSFLSTVRCCSEGDGDCNGGTCLSFVHVF